MKRKKITLSQAIDGFRLEKSAQGLSPKTLLDYGITFRRFSDYIGDPILSDVTATDIVNFLAHLVKQPIAPAGIAPRPKRILTNKSLLNAHTALASLWTWAVAGGFAPHHVVRDVPRPQPERTAIKPFTRDDVKRLLDACDSSRTYARPGQRECSNARPTADRDRAIILLLLDTGIRAGELCDLKIRDLDQRNLSIRVFGKGRKERIIPISTRTQRRIWRYLLDRPDARPPEPLFLSQYAGQGLTVSGLDKLIKRLGDRAGVRRAHPHRFRHTFAVEFIRNGGNAYALQMLLGHSTLDMVRRYLDLAEADADAAHKRASPVTNWGL